MPDKYTRIIRRALSQPWALTPEYLTIVQDILRFRAHGGRLTADEIRARIGLDDVDDAPAPTARTAGAVAIVPFHGVIAHRTFDASSGMTSTEMIGRMIDHAVADESVTSIIGDFSTPGGGVEGVPELGAKLFAARKKKYMVAHVNDLMASAGYWLGSQFTEIVSTPSGSAGSIGVYALHEDLSEMLANEGIKITAISAGDRKLEGAPWEPLDEDAKRHFQANVDRVYKEFLSAVARGRGLEVKVIEETFGQGRVYDAKEAKKRGMVDRIETLDETIARLSAGGRRASGPRAEGDITPNIRTETPNEDGKCPECNGSGLRPERFMSDPQGQETCPSCAGSGKNDVPKAASTDQAAADREALDLLMR